VTMQVLNMDLANTLLHTELKARVGQDKSRCNFDKLNNMPPLVVEHLAQSLELVGN
jgi:hypothetical protein